MQGSIMRQCSAPGSSIPAEYGNSYRGCETNMVCDGRLTSVSRRSEAQRILRPVHPFACSINAGRAPADPGPIAAWRCATPLISALTLVGLCVIALVLAAKRSRIHAS